MGSADTNTEHSVLLLMVAKGRLAPGQQAFESTDPEQAVVSTDDVAADHRLRRVVHRPSPLGIHFYEPEETQQPAQPAPLISTIPP